MEVRLQKGMELTPTDSFRLTMAVAHACTQSERAQDLFRVLEQWQKERETSVTEKKEERGSTLLPGSDVWAVLYYISVENWFASDDRPRPTDIVEAYEWELSRGHSGAGPEDLAKYTHGKALHIQYLLVSTDRSTVLGEHHLEDLAARHTLVSEAIRVPHGYIATSEAERFYALAERKKMT